jgi:hypothetical protein
VLKMKKSLCVIILWAVFALMMFSGPAFSATTSVDLLVGAKTLPLLNDPMTGTASLAIIFDPASTASVSEANEIKSILGNGFEVPGDLKLVGALVSVEDLGKLSAARIAILTTGLGSHFNAIGAAAARNRVLTMSTDLGCVEAERCVLGIKSQPHVEIYFSKTAADAAQITFGQVFTMLVKQI